MHSPSPAVPFSISFSFSTFHPFLCPFLPLFLGCTPMLCVWGFPTNWGVPLIRALPPDDGKLFHGSGVGDPFGPRCYKGDVMGCGIMFPRDYGRDSEGTAGLGTPKAWAGPGGDPSPFSPPQVTAMTPRSPPR